MHPSRALPLLLLLPLFLLLGPVRAEPPGLEAVEDGGLAVGTDEGTDGGTEAAEVLPGLVPPAPVPSRKEDPPFAHLRPLPRQQDVLARAKRDARGRLVLPGSKGEVPLTIEPGLQEELTAILRRYEVPYGAVVVLEPSTGRVLAMAEHSAASPGLRGLSTRAVFPAASIFKIVTGSALLEAGVSPVDETCFHGGKRRLSEKLLEDSTRDGRCHSLAEAMALSANVVFAKLTQRYLSPEALRLAAARFHFNREITFPVPTDVSLAAVPEEEFPLAETGAGFGDVYLSPLHGALMAAVVANGGVWRAPILFEPEADTPSPGEQVLTPEVARHLTDMLEETVTRGTARRIFRERGMRVPGAVGKTGTLADRNPFRDYSWFVGFAPRDEPRLAVAAVIVNEPLWRIRATWLGREALRLGLARIPRRATTEDSSTAEGPPSEEDGALEAPPEVEVSSTWSAPMGPSVSAAP